jgi:methionine-R-sulfoxide reductase
MSMSYRDYQKPAKEVLRATLDPLVYAVTQEEGTERAGTSPLLHKKRPGLFVDVLSGEPLFLSSDKYDSGTGWPSFVKPVHPNAITTREDRTLFFATRTEVRSAHADNHLGHVFADGPRERGGLRYCLNGAALRFIPKEDMALGGYGEFVDQV